MGLRRLMVGLVVLGVGRNGDTPVAPINPTETNTIIVTAAGASPQQSQIQAGDRVLFVNNDDVVHNMSSDNHPSH